jgi:hypothetical protein
MMGADAPIPLVVMNGRRPRGGFRNGFHYRFSGPALAPPWLEEPEGFFSCFILAE